MFGIEFDRDKLGLYVGNGEATINPALAGEEGARILSVNGVPEMRFIYDDKGNILPEGASQELITATLKTREQAELVIKSNSGRMRDITLSPLSPELEERLRNIMASIPQKKEPNRDIIKTGLRWDNKRKPYQVTSRISDAALARVFNK